MPGSNMNSNVFDHVGLKVELVAKGSRGFYRRLREIACCVIFEERVLEVKAPRFGDGARGITTLGLRVAEPLNVFEHVGTAREAPFGESAGQKTVLSRATGVKWFRHRSEYA